MADITIKPENIFVHPITITPLSIEHIKQSYPKLWQACIDELNDIVKTYTPDWTDGFIAHLCYKYLFETNFEYRESVE